MVDMPGNDTPVLEKLRGAKRAKRDSLELLRGVGIFIEVYCISCKVFSLHF